MPRPRRSVAQKRPEPKNNECGFCKDKANYTRYAVCESCVLWYHPECFNLDPEEIDKLEDWHCPQCKVDSRTTSSAQVPLSENLSSNLPSQPLTSEPIPSTSAGNQPGVSSDTEVDSQSSDYDTDDDNYAGVREITNSKRTSHGRMFRVVFKKSGQARWLPEKECTGCLRKVNEYLRKIGENQSRLEPTSHKCGALREGNENNWAEIGEILQAAITYGKKELLQPTIFQELGPQDSIQLIQVENHCFTALWMASGKKVLISDGENSFAKDGWARKTLIGYLSRAKSITHLPFNGQREKDHCASSAAGIAIEFQRIHAKGSWAGESEIIVPPTIMERLRQRFHKEPGPKLNTWQPIRERNFELRCPKCNMKMKSNNRGTLALHLPRCPAKDL